MPERDDFFALSGSVYRFLATIRDVWGDVAVEHESACSSLASLGILETDPVTEARPYSGPSFIGEFLELPTVREPLVLNCFATAHCPLRCVYCHADDLMGPVLRDGESATDGLESVVATASSVPALVAVITGGDPLTRPERASFLIRRLAGQKALVLDTAGVGDFERLVPDLVEHSVHVRVSLDSVDPRLNDKLRPGNAAYRATRDASFTGAVATIRRCLDADIPLTVQTVVSQRNEDLDAWRGLRSWLLAEGVRHWVLHSCVLAGSARRVESSAGRRRSRGILPRPDVAARLWTLVAETVDEGLPIDIRCTDTRTSPNAVLLVGSNGDLFTEGYAHKGKVRLFEAGRGRPDLVRALWPYIDRFGHAKRYLNWNEEFFDKRSLEDICIKLEGLETGESSASELVETEFKRVVKDRDRLRELLEGLGFVETERAFQRDEYFDTPARTLSSIDFVARLRLARGKAEIALKGPRDFSSDGASSRIEIEVPCSNEEEARAALRRPGMGCTWYFEKRRITYQSETTGLTVAVDEVPEIGWYAELEGHSLDRVRELLADLSPALGPPEVRNYRDIFGAHRVGLGDAPEEVPGASFAGE